MEGVEQHYYQLGKLDNSVHVFSYILELPEYIETYKLPNSILMLHISHKTILIP